MPPGWDGIETVEQIWLHDPCVEVVLCTAYSDHSWHEIFGRLNRSGRLLVLKKPFDPMEVRQLAASLTEKWSLGEQARLQVENLEANVAERTEELVREVAERQLLSDAYKEISQQSRQVLEWVGHGLMTIDTQGTIHFANQRAAQLLGCSAESLAGQRFHESVAHTRSDGSQFSWSESPIDGALRSGKSFSSRGDLFHRLDGVEFSVDFICNVTRGDDNEVFRAVVTFRDLAAGDSSTDSGACL